MKIYEKGIIPQTLEFFENLKLNCSNSIGIYPKNLELFQNDWNFLRNQKLNLSKRIGIFPMNLELFQKYWNFLRYSKLKCSKKIGIFPKNLELTCSDLFMYDSKCFGGSNFFGFHKGIEKMMMINEVNTMTTRQNDLVVKNLRVVGIGSSRILGLFLHCIILQEKTFEYLYNETCNIAFKPVFLFSFPKK